MSVTIVAALPKAPQTATPAPADTTPSNTATIDTTADGADFASLLMGQLAPVVPEVLPETLAKTDSETPLENAAPAEAASLLAALGLVPTEPVRNTTATQTSDSSLRGVGKTDKTISNPLAPIQATIDSEPTPNIKAEVKGEPVKTESLPNGTTTVDDKAAKIAVTPLITPQTEAVVSKTSSADVLPNNVSALTTNTPSNTNGMRDNALTVTTPVRDQSWAGDFSQKIVWMASNNKQAAQLTLNPPQMGPIEISLTMDKGNATATFVSANADVRDAIETALPRLREMFANAGISLGQTNVSAESFSQQAGNREGNLSDSQWMSDNAILGADATGSLTSRAYSARQGNGLVDIFV